MPGTGKIPAHFVRITQAYLLAWSSIALAASIGALDRYASGPVSTRVFAIVGTCICGILLLGLLTELVMSQREHTNNIMWNTLDWMHCHNIPDRGVHIAVQLMSIVSVSLAAVNMHSEVWDWQFGLSATLVGMVLFYNVLYAQAILVSVAMYNHLPEAAQAVVAEQYRATTYVWKKSQVDDRLMASVM